MSHDSHKILNENSEDNQNKNGSDYSSFLLLSINKLIQSGLVAVDARNIVATAAAETGANKTVTSKNSIYKDSDTLSASHNPEHTPWFLQILLGISGFFAGAAIIAFISLLMESTIEETGTQVTVGLILLIISFALFKVNQSKHNTFIGSLAFAISVAGQIFMAIAIFDNDLSTTAKVLMLMLFQMLMALSIANLAHRIANFYVVFGCIVWLLSYYNAPELAAGFLALVTCMFGLQRYEWIDLLGVQSANMRAIALQVSRAVAYASSLMLLVISVYFISADYGHNMLESGYHSFYYHYPLAQGMLILASGYAVYIILKRYGLLLRSQAGMSILAALVVLGALSVYVSGLLATSLVIIIALANRQRILMALGVIALVSYIFWYYYQLDTTLLLKSASMLAVGMGVLLMRWLLISNYFAERSVSTISKPDPNERQHVVINAKEDNS